jgi:eukaryotic-like serine/threonine-protein kinase
MIGRAIKHYEIEEELGKGGMGVVYRARDTRLGRAVAIKLLPPEFTKDPDRKGRFLQEARAASAVNHPAIAQIYDVDEGENGVFFIAMELVPGKTVKALVQARELDLLGALEVGLQVAGGLQKAHEAGIVHRDVKPENVMVTPDGHAKILDFGLAKLTEPAGGSADEVSHMETLARTQAGMVLGTLRYMSPEQARGQAVDHRSDIFSFGVLLYEMVTGQLPFSGNTPVDTLHAIAFEETRPITQIRANLPPSLQRVISRCLRKRAPDRYPDCKELSAELKTVQREAESGISAKVTLGERLREQLASLGGLTPRAWIVPTVVGALLVAVLAAFFLRDKDPFGSLIGLGIVGLFVWRRHRNRRQRLSRKFTARARKLPEVRIVALEGTKLTVVADQAVAKTYVRLNAILDGINGAMFYGDPFTITITDELGPEEVRTLLKGPGILFMRDEPAARQARPA